MPQDTPAAARRSVGAGLLGVATMCALAACGSMPADPETLLQQAKQAVDATPSAHFQLSSSSLQGDGPFITGGSGDMKRPASFQGTLHVEISGFEFSVAVVAVNNAFYAKLPTSSSFQVTNPADYGFGNPAQLLDPQHGLSHLLVICAHPVLGSDDRYNGEQLHEVSCSLPGAAVKALLTDAAPQQPVPSTFGIDVDNHQLRKVVLTGPFFSASQNSTFTVIIDNYGESIAITPPAGASGT